MSNGGDWLPPMMELGDYGGDSRRYIDGLYKRYLDDVGGRKLRFRGRPVSLRYHEPYDGKGAGFWHCISEGGIEESRTPDLERCRRVPWIGAVIKNCDDPTVLYWVERRGSQTDHILWVREEFVVVLSERGTAPDGGPDAYLLKTAFCTLSERQRERKRKARAEAKKASTAPCRTVPNTPSTHGG